MGQRFDGRLFRGRVQVTVSTLFGLSGTDCIQYDFCRENDRFRMIIWSVFALVERGNDGVAHASQKSVDWHRGRSISDHCVRVDSDQLGETPAIRLEVD